MLAKEKVDIANIRGFHFSYIYEFSWLFEFLEESKLKEISLRFFYS